MQRCGGRLATAADESILRKWYEASAKRLKLTPELVEASVETVQPSLVLSAKENLCFCTTLNNPHPSQNLQ
jgi:hypothetical protein